jgi:DNA-binding HxlR family transcriptional regulator
LLKELEDMGLVSGKVIDGRPPRVEYSLTEKGKEIAKILDELDEILQK